MKSSSGLVWVACRLRRVAVASFLLVCAVAAIPAGAAATPQNAPPTTPSTPQVATPQAPAPNRSTTPDQVVTSDGSIVEGTIQTMEAGSMTLKTKFGGTLTVKQSSVVAVSTANAIEVVTYDGRVLRGRLSTNAAGSVVVTPSDGGAAVTLAWREIAELYKATPRWGGSMTFGFSENSGNTETIGATVGADGTRTGERNRTTAKALFTLIESFHANDARKFSGTLQYDHYLRPRLYAHFTEEVTHDAKQDLDLRTASHIGIGYDLLERPSSTLSAEIGVGLLLNRYEVDTANNDTDFSGRGAIHVKLPLGHGVTVADDFVFFLHDESHVNNVATVTFKLSAAWAFKVTANLQVNSDPSTLADKWDHQTILGVTYSF